MKKSLIPLFHKCKLILPAFIQTIYIFLCPFATHIAAVVIFVIEGFVLIIRQLLNLVTLLLHQIFKFIDLPILQLGIGWASWQAGFISYHIR